MKKLKYYAETRYFVAFCTI